MLTANDAIHGWSPAGDDDVEVNVSQDMYFMAISPIASSSLVLSPICPPLNTTLPKTRCPQSQSTTLAPLMDVTRTAIAPSSDRRAQRNRNRDPSWIPRPRNAFIIFRCEYSREHAQGAQESQNDQDSNNASVKTLSKRAADAWKQLPPSEKERYKILADKEREEHARLHPHYRFRPMKRQVSVSGTRRDSWERSQSPKAASVESRPAPSAHIPSVLTAAPEKPRSNPSVDRVEVSPPVLQVAAAPLPEPSSYPIDLTGTDAELPLGVNYNDHVLFYPSPEPTLPSDSSPPSGSVELYSPLCTSEFSIPPDMFRCNDSTFGLDPTQEDLERAQALEAYATGLYHHDLFSPFPFPEYY
ncbi:hypothetical protein JVT61DRAFT_2740 [Boletus reticuloceps]|uniref:HMG box domain-containing protein n=1 Tax=Boletus reticuloceps TaxID=495285 RepID=A0A8I3AAX5_9AGAM|nr:hypothetical protein JVT61DRAFT_2740 [Boletus reticuloceps]